MNLCLMYTCGAPNARREQTTKARSGSSVWLERSPVTAEVASSSLVRFVPTKRDAPIGCIPFCIHGVRALNSRPRSRDPRIAASRMRAESPVGFLPPELPTHLLAGTADSAQPNCGSGVDASSCAKFTRIKETGRIGGADVAQIQVSRMEQSAIPMSHFFMEKGEVVEVFEMHACESVAEGILTPRRQAGSTAQLRP